MKKHVLAAAGIDKPEALVRELQAEPKQATQEPEPLTPQDRDAVDKFQTRLGTKVNLVRGKKGGRLVIHFYSEEELQAIYEAIVGHE